MSGWSSTLLCTNPCCRSNFFGSEMMTPCFFLESAFFLLFHAKDGKSLASDVRVSISQQLREPWHLGSVSSRVWSCVWVELPH